MSEERNVATKASRASDEFYRHTSAILSTSISDSQIFVFALSEI